MICLSAVKSCTACGIEKSLTDFGKSSQSKDGFKSSCLSCKALKSALYRALNRDALKAYGVQYRKNSSQKVRDGRAFWRKENPDKVALSKAKAYRKNEKKIKAKASLSYIENPEKFKVRAAAWRLANPDKVKAKDAEYYAAHPEAGRIKGQNRRARKRNVGGALSKGLAVKLFKLQRGKCPCCGLPLGSDFHLDHKMPLALGGSNTDENIQLLRKRCNSQKHAAHPVDFMQSRGFLL